MCVLLIMNSDFLYLLFVLITFFSMSSSVDRKCYSGGLTQQDCKERNGACAIVYKDDNEFIGLACFTDNCFKKFCPNEEYGCKPYNSGNNKKICKLRVKKRMNYQVCCCKASDKCMLPPIVCSFKDGPSGQAQECDGGREPTQTAVICAAIHENQQLIGLCCFSQKEAHDYCSRGYNECYNIKITQNRLCGLTEIKKDKNYDVCCCDNKFGCNKDEPLNKCYRQIGVGTEKTVHIVRKEEYPACAKIEQGDKFIGSCYFYKDTIHYCNSHANGNQIEQCNDVTMEKNDICRLPVKKGQKYRVCCCTKYLCNKPPVTCDIKNGPQGVTKCANENTAACASFYSMGTLVGKCCFTESKAQQYCTSDRNRCQKVVIAETPVCELTNIQKNVEYEVCCCNKKDKCQPSEPLTCHFMNGPYDEFQPCYTENPLACASFEDERNLIGLCCLNENQANDYCPNEEYTTDVKCHDNVQMKISGTCMLTGLIKDNKYRVCCCKKKNSITPPLFTCTFNQSDSTSTECSTDRKGACAYIEEKNEFIGQCCFNEAQVKKYCKNGENNCSEVKVKEDKMCNLQKIKKNTKYYICCCNDKYNCNKNKPLLCHKNVQTSCKTTQAGACASIYTENNNLVHCCFDKDERDKYCPKKNQMCHSQLKEDEQVICNLGVFAGWNTICCCHDDDYCTDNIKTTTTISTTTTTQTKQITINNQTTNSQQSTPSTTPTQGAGEKRKLWILLYWLYILVVYV